MQCAALYKDLAPLKDCAKVACDVCKTGTATIDAFCFQARAALSRSCYWRQYEQSERDVKRGKDSL